MSREFMHLEASEAELMEVLHDNTMGDQPVKACTSRCFKEVLPVLGRWIQAERDRATAPEVLCMVSADIAASIAVTIVRNSGPHVTDAIAAPLVEIIARRLKAGLDDAAAHLRNPDQRRCRSCGCTESSACVTDDGACSWSEPDLCSACAARGRERKP